MSSKRKTATLPRQTSPKDTSQAPKANGFLTILVIASIAVVVLGLLVLKDKKGSAVALATPQPGSPAVARSGATTGPFKPTSPSDQLNQALAAGKPTLVFMHSTNCQSCIDMMNVVDQVYPEFAGQVTLVDVDVYNDANVPLMQLLGLRYIPTVVVFDKEGTQSQNVGAMKVDAFRTFLLQNALGG